MADVAKPCTCSPYLNICCCGAKNGISVVQPACQNLPDGSVVNNPAFVPELDKSFWTYKLITDCSQATKAISNFVIPVCDIIPAENIIVSEKIDGCGQFVPVPFTLTKTDPNFGTAPEGFQFLKIETEDRYEKGVSVEYRLEIVGDFPLAVQPIKVKAGTSILTFECDDCFLVPECNPQGELVLIKECGHTIINNQATLHYSLSVTNIGNAALDDVDFKDTIFIPTQLITGPITVTPPTLTVDTTIPGQVRISGNLGTIEPGGVVPITYEIPIASITTAGEYLINNTADVSAKGTKDSASCTTKIDVVELRADKCCTIDGNQGTYTLTISSENDSPDIVVDIHDHMEVPTGVTIKFTSFNGCEARFSGSGDPVPLNTDITGPVGLDFICKSALIPSGGSFQKTLSFTLVSSSVLGTAVIDNTITEVIPVDPGAQVLLGVLNLPASAQIDIQLNMICQKPCL